MKKTVVVKASGEKELFSEKKVRRSIRRAGIPKKLEEQVVSHVYSTLYDGIPTYEIYKHITEFLGRSSLPYTRAVYSLKQAIMQLGPGGFPFEKFVAAILQHNGYKVQTNVILSGKCVEHEIDVIAQKDGKRYMIECKFHNRPGARSDVKVALYTQARFEDCKNNNKNQSLKDQYFQQTWIVTNTKTTTEAIKYAKCVGMKIIGWNYPDKENIQYFVESSGLHPITSLTSLSQNQISQILEQGIVLCIDLLDKKQNILDRLKLSKNQKELIIKEIKLVCRKRDK